MIRNTQERFAPKALAIAIAAIGCVGVAPLAAADDDEIALFTKPESTVEVGALHVSDSNTKLGDYTGLNKSGAYGIGNASLVLRGNDAYYLDINGSNLGLDSRSLSVEGGRQGDFGIRINYDQLPHFWAHGYQSPFQGLGSSNVTLPAGWVRGATTTAMGNQIRSNMRPFEVKTERETFGLGVNKFITGHWELVANFKRDQKQGNKLVGAVVGNSGGNPRAAILPEPVDWTTDQAEIFARYSFEKLQFQFGYYGSFFKNGNQALAWQNPYSGTVWGGAAGAFPNAQLGLAPDNQFHQLNASAGYNYSPVTRVSGAFSIGRATQNENFLPYTVNPGLVTTGLPRSSLDGEVINTNASLNFTTKLMPKLGLVAGYRYVDRDNRTPQSQYNYVGGDSNAQALLLNTSRARTNLPVSSTKHQVHADLDYHLSPETKVNLGYEFDHVKKTFEAIDWEREHTFKTGVKHRFGEMTSAGASYEYSDRDTSAYNASAPFIASYSSQYVATLAPNLVWDNVPIQKKFFMAPRKRDKLRAFVNVSPTDRLDLEFSADYKDDRYTKSVLGLRQATGWAGNFDANLALSEAFSANLFVTLENYQTNQRSAQITGATQADFANPNRFWTADIEDRTYTWGVGFRGQPMPKLEVGGNFTQAYSKGKVDVSRASTLVNAVREMPDLDTRMDRFELFGNYQLQKDLKLRLQYVHQRYRSTDWALDGVAAAATGAPNNGMANVIGTNQVSPDFNVDVVGLSAIYSFR